MSPKKAVKKVRPVAAADAVEYDGDLPEGWRKCRVSDLFSIRSGGTPSRNNSKFWNGNISWLSSGDIKTNTIEVGSEFITEEGLEHSTAKLCNPGSVVVVVRSGILKHTLPVAILQSPSAINQDIKCFDSGDEELNQWFAWALRASEPEILSKNREGTTVQSIKTETLLNFVLPLPPLSEQRRIVSRLELLLGKVTSVRERLSGVAAILKRFRQSVLAAACSGRLTEDWREENTDALSAETILGKIKKDRKKRAGTLTAHQRLSEIFSVIEDGDSEELPESWCYVLLNKLCDSFDYGTSAKSQKTGDVPVLRMGNIQDGRIDWSDLVFTSNKAEIEKYRLKPNTVLFNRTNSPELVGKTAIYRGEQPAIFAGYLIRINPCTHLDPEYLNLCLNTVVAKEFCSRVKSDGVSQSNINAQKLGSFEIPFAPLAEQREIVRRVESLFSYASRIESRLSTARSAVEKLTQSILAKAFRGELVPTDAELGRLEATDRRDASIDEKTAKRLANRTRLKNRSKADKAACALFLDLVARNPGISMREHQRLWVCGIAPPKYQNVLEKKRLSHFASILKKSLYEEPPGIWSQLREWLEEEYIIVDRNDNLQRMTVGPRFQSFAKDLEMKSDPLRAEFAEEVLETLADIDSSVVQADKTQTVSQFIDSDVELERNRESLQLSS